MIVQLILPIALLPQRESDIGDVIKIVILLLLPALIGIGKTILDKSKAKETARARQRGPIPAGPGSRPAASARPREREDEAVDPGEFWDELVAQATGAQPAGAARIVPLPAGVEAERLAGEPLGVNLDVVDDSLPSHHEEYFESHENADLAPRGAVGAGFRPTPVVRRRPHAATSGHSLRGTIQGRDGWKRAIVLAEVLGVPLGLRKEDRRPGMG